MIATDKERIRLLRGSGHGYKAISAKLNLPAATVKSYCLRNGLKAKADELPENSCLHCEKPLGNRLPGAVRKKFCSDSCRNKWWSSHADARARDKDRRVCAHCRREFYSCKPKKYCTHGCYTIARWGRKHHDA